MRVREGEGDMMGHRGGGGYHGVEGGWPRGYEAGRRDDRDDIAAWLSVHTGNVLNTNSSS